MCPCLAVYVPVCIVACLCNRPMLYRCYTQLCDMCILQSTQFFAHPPGGANGTVAVMTKAVVDKLIHGGSLRLAYAQSCCVS